MAIIKIVPFPGPKGDKGDQGDPGQGGGSGLDGIKSKVWGYPTTNGVAIYPDTAGESIAIKSSQSAALRWHIRDGGSSVVRQNLELLSINNPGTDGNIVTFNIDEQEFPPPIGYHYSVNINTGDSQYAGSYISTASTTTTLTLDYVSSTDSFNRTDVTGTIYLPSVYNQVEARQDGIWIKNANWSEEPTYSNSWQFTNDGAIHFPYSQSNQRTGYGDVLRFANSFDQSIIMGPKTTESAPTANRLVIAGSDGYPGSTGEGGDVYLWAGRGGDAGGTGGDIKVDAGNGELAGEGGTVKVRGGYSPEGTGGFVEITAGGSGTGSGGPVYVSAGSSSGNAGTVTINGGMSYGANGGNVNISAGFSYAQGYSAGSVQINAPMDGKVLINGGGGEFINDANDANNQIATVGNVAAVTSSGVTGSFTSQDGKLITVTNGIITGIEVV